MVIDRVLLYGASNLWLSRRQALTEVRKRFPGRLQIGLAHGPGRSYGLRAGNPFLRYEPLSQVHFCFPEESRGRRLAVLTDLGNDIAYSQEPQRILSWFDRLTERLHNQGYQIIVGGIPVKSLSRINPRLFGFLARLYYPDGTVHLHQVLRDLEELEIGVRELCRDRRIPYVESRDDWYTFDHFHLRQRARFPYWQALLQELPQVTYFRSTWSLKTRRPILPERCWVLGREKVGRGKFEELVPKSTLLVR